MSGTDIRDINYQGCRTQHAQHDIATPATSIQALNAALAAFLSNDGQNNSNP
jgi:hypothetical protein